MRCLVAILSLLFADACVALESVDYGHVLGETGLTVRHGEPPAGCEPLGTIVVKETGYYVFASLPIVEVSMSRALREVGRRAEALGATGVAHLDVDYEPATLFDFVIFPLPDWTATLKMTAMAYR